MNRRLLKNRLVCATSLFIGLFSSHRAVAQWTPVDTAGFAIHGNDFTHLFADAQDSLYVSFAGPGMVMKYNGTHWAAVGGPITTDTVSDSWSAKAPNGNLYYSYIAHNTRRAAVSMYNGTAWASLGTGISSDTATYTNVAISSAGVPYFSYLQGNPATASLYVRRYNAGSWDTVGHAAVTTTGANYPNMVLGLNDTIYVAYMDQAASQNMTVKKFNGTAWVQVGTSFCAQPLGGGLFTSMAIDRNGVPYVSYMSPYPMGPKICVSKYDGSNWVTVGSPSFTSSGAIFNSIAIDKNGNPYVSFMDNGNGGKIGVVKYDGSSWNVVGNAGSASANGVVFTSMVIDANNNPFVAYKEPNGGTTVLKYPVCTAPFAATVSANDTSICKGTSVALTATGTLNDATKWYWYAGSCSGSLIDSGATINKAPGDTMTYYVHGGGGCVLYSACSQFTVFVDSMIKPVVTNASGTVSTITVAVSYQWYKGNTAISGATSQSYAVTASGWYKLMTYNANNCSATSDSIYVAPAGVANLNNNSGVNMYPTVFSDRINVDLVNVAFDSKMASLVIKDNMGRTVFEQKRLSAQNSIQLSSLAPGLYFANIITPGNMYVFKLLK